MCKPGGNADAAIKPKEGQVSFCDGITSPKLFVNVRGRSAGVASFLSISEMFDSGPLGPSLKPHTCHHTHNVQHTTPHPSEEKCTKRNGSPGGTAV